MCFGMEWPVKCPPAWTSCSMSRNPWLHPSSSTGLFTMCSECLLVSLNSLEQAQCKSRLLSHCEQVVCSLQGTEGGGDNLQSAESPANLKNAPAPCSQSVTQFRTYVWTGICWAPCGHRLAQMGVGSARALLRPPGSFFIGGPTHAKPVAKHAIPESIDEPTRETWPLA